MHSRCSHWAALMKALLSSRVAERLVLAKHKGRVLNLSAKLKLPVGGEPQKAESSLPCLISAAGAVCRANIHLS